MLCQLDLRVAVWFGSVRAIGRVRPGASASAPHRHARRSRGDLLKLQNKRRSPLPVDFDVGQRLLLEVDEPQHFSTPRLQTLDFYEGLQHDLDIDRYRDLCIRYSGEADSYRRTKAAADFPFPGGRTAQRAYLDAVRDLLAPAFGFMLIRVPSPTRDMRRAALEAVEAIRRRIEGRV